jgi:uncharacterized repeat protein (TIGR03803 family)
VGAWWSFPADVGQVVVGCKFRGKILSDRSPIFQLAPPSTSGSVWHENVLYRFQGASDGANPSGPLTSDRRGGFYGTNSGQAFGTVFDLTPPSSGGSWTLNTLYTFQGGTDGSYPQSGVIADNQGNLYGTTAAGGNAGACLGGCGTVYRLVRHNGWQEQVLHRFSRHAGDGQDPESSLLMLGGKLYGTTYIGGSTLSGIVFELTPPGP